jgi:Ti-type conjugative transfer relaxase TraA
MAIAFARARYISRSTGGSAARSAAYNARAEIGDERTGEVFYFKHRDAPEHHEVLLPDGADEKFADAATLWNAAEAAERRKDSQVAREIVMALPANAEVSNEDRIELARSFALEHFVAKGLGVQLDIHAPHGGDLESERANFHAHLLITTRRIEGDRLSATKARDLAPDIRQAGARSFVAEGEEWGKLWREHQDRYFLSHGFSARVDATATHAQEHIGPLRMRAAESEANERTREIARANGEAARDPGKVLEALTRNNATFSERDLDRYLSKHIFDEAERAGVHAKVFSRDELVPLHERETGEASGRFTTRRVRAEEREALQEARGLADARHHKAAPESAKRRALAEKSLREDQRAAFEHATAEGGLKIIEGRAGTGKSFTLAAIRDAHHEQGRRVIGLAPTNSVAEDLKADGFSRASTVHAELFRLKNGRAAWDKNTVVIVDEAAMLDTRVTRELLLEARRGGARLILAGDDRQLASIERGGLFSELKQRHGSAEITEVTRQRVDWQRRASRDLAAGNFVEAVSAFAKNGAIVWTDKQDQARAALVERWRQDTARDPEATRFVFAYTNKDVNALNEDLRAARRERGELSGEDARFETKHGAAMFAVGDRVQFTDTRKSAKIYNGNVGTITGLDARSGLLHARLDGPQGAPGREVVWSASEFDGFRHGYAGTIYKGQGKTLDHTYLYHTEHWRQAASYVALTRQRESATIFVARETARNPKQLAWQMARGEVKSASLAWATRDELAPALRAKVDAAEARAGEKPKEKPEEKPQEKPQEKPTTDAAMKAAPVSPSEAVRTAELLNVDMQARFDRRASVDDRSIVSRDRVLKQQRAEKSPRRDEPDWLIAPRVSPDGRDSLGRGLDEESVSAFVANDKAVRRERQALSTWLEAAYRDPNEATKRLDALVQRDGFASAARRIESDPTQLGAYAGKTGLFAGAAARQERANARRVAESIGPGLARLGEAEAFSARDYRAGVEKQLQADATGVPRPSERAQAAIDVVRAAKTDKERADAWKATTSDKAVAGELTAFAAAMEKRFGADGVRAMIRSEQAGAKAFDGGASVATADRQAVAEAGRATSIIKSGERALASSKVSERLSQQSKLGAGLKP